MTKRLLNISPDGNPSCLRAEGFKEALSEFGELTLLSGGDRMSEQEIAGHVRRCHVYLVGHGTTPLPKCLAEDRGNLEYICGITGTMRPFVPVELVGEPLQALHHGPRQRVELGRTREGEDGQRAIALETDQLLAHHVPPAGWPATHGTGGGPRADSAPPPRRGEPLPLTAVRRGGTPSRQRAASGDRPPCLPSPCRPGPEASSAT